MSRPPCALLTGGAGYIGSHTCIALLEAGWDVVLLDNLSNSTADVVERIATISGRRPTFVQGDVRDAELVHSVLEQHQCQAVIHFAGLKAVGESVAKPLLYFENNVAGTIALLGAMHRAGTRQLVFSSSATVYGSPQRLPIDESHPTSALNPYGRSKLHVEEILSDLCASDPTWRVVCLRYFNPCGAHPSGLIGEDPKDIPNNLMPFVARVATGQLPLVQVFGGDYETPDGTGVRDYIHVQDLAAGHLNALDYCAKAEGWHAINLGTGRGFSVIEMIRAFEKASGQPIPYKIVDRRPGDAASCWADASKAQRELGWSARFGIDEMCADAWRWQQHARQKG
ncbi:UDP-glucose 4-epimerase GalE [Ramlibacter algicola]|uniref:UDP-glucose 4-epimerase n=1 Tax=Ramlibacter algicola TaxID=2795217 RepID=A0A934Q0C2_9BURK|nr:UDP-glucose 4-epimerase GalE [Ramlibacter algicola]MBK0391962.1 UDP-glucose 4-epimerase GalE [Ramlibacter algicola]